MIPWSEMPRSIWSRLKIDIISIKWYFASQDIPRSNVPFVGLLRSKTSRNHFSMHSDCLFRKSGLIFDDFMVNLATCPFFAGAWLLGVLSYSFAAQLCDHCSNWFHCVPFGTLVASQLVMPSCLIFLC